MYRTLASTGGVFEGATVLQAAGSGVLIWMTVLGACSVLLGIGIVLQRRARSALDAGATSESPLHRSPSRPSVRTDEEQVLEMLESNGGRMRQSRIAERTDWSKSKVSMLLSEMETDGTIHKLRVGRENIVSLPEDDPVPDWPGNQGDT